MEEFSRISIFLRGVHRRYLYTVSAFNVWDSIKKQMADEKKRDIYNKYNQFFIIAEESLRIFFLLELAKIYDVADESLHIYKIVNYAESNIRKLSKEEFLKFHGDRKFNEELLAEYTQLDQNDIKDIRRLLKNNEASIGKLKDYRDKYLAHNDIKRTEVNISITEIKKLLEITEKIINLFSSKFDFSSYWYGFQIENCQRDTEWLFKDLVNLKEFERIEFEKKWGK